MHIQQNVTYDLDHSADFVNIISVFFYLVSLTILYSTK